MHNQKTDYGEVEGELRDSSSLTSINRDHVLFDPASKSIIRMDLLQLQAYV